MHPLAAPGALWVLSRAGKVPRPPAGGRNLPQETGFLWWQGKEPFFLFLFLRGFRLCGGDQRAFRSPFGNLRPPCCGWKFPQEIRCFLAFPVSQGFASAEATKGLSGRPLETFGAHPVEAVGDHKNRFHAEGKGKNLYFLFLFLRRFRLCGGDQRAFRSPFGNLRSPPC